MKRVLRVGDLMTPAPETVLPDTPLRRVLKLMKADGCRQLPVVSEAGKLVGIITDRDVRLAMNSPFVLRERSQDEALLNNLPAEGCMTPDPLTVTAGTPAYQAAELLSAHKYGALPVVDGGKLVGIVSVTDFLRRFAADQRDLAESIGPLTSN